MNSQLDIGKAWKIENLDNANFYQRKNWSDQQSTKNKALLQMEKGLFSSCVECGIRTSTPPAGAYGGANRSP